MGKRKADDVTAPPSGAKKHKKRAGRKIDDPPKPIKNQFQAIDSLFEPNKACLNSTQYVSFLDLLYVDLALMHFIVTHLCADGLDEKEKEEGAIFSLSQIFCDTKTNIKSTMFERTVTEAQEISREGAPEGPPLYGVYPIRPAAGYQNPVRVEFEEGETEVKEAERTRSLVPTAPRAEHEQRRKGGAIPSVQRTGERADRFENVDPLRG
ncbi:hypothetical protein NDU88_013183 [Pleurodeles waltl]|uniref:Uncharacterized protein n=1 Tax=Pleurodeles waltl TaxID=8319 RepID=A0AAV7R2B1_PLEWA|nr:hypothetical protein NDU88_013183 [Pleurodeles waltl]